jgi:hypothetical protein
VLARAGRERRTGVRHRATVQAQRFLAQHVLAGLERTHRPLEVQLIRQRNVDRIDFRIGE